MRGAISGGAAYAPKLHNQNYIHWQSWCKHDSHNWLQTNTLSTFLHNCTRLQSYRKVKKLTWLKNKQLHTSQCRICTICICTGVYPLGWFWREKMFNCTLFRNLEYLQWKWKTSIILYSEPLTLEVQMTSLKLMFIQLSQLTKCPLYVSPFFNSTSCKMRSRVESRHSN